MPQEPKVIVRQIVPAEPGWRVASAWFNEKTGEGEIRYDSVFAWGTQVTDEFWAARPGGCRMSASWPGQSAGAAAQLACEVVAAGDPGRWPWSSLAPRTPPGAVAEAAGGAFGRGGYSPPPRTERAPRHDPQQGLPPERDRAGRRERFQGRAAVPGRRWATLRAGSPASSRRKHSRSSPPSAARGDAEAPTKEVSCTSTAAPHRPVERLANTQGHFLRSALRSAFSVRHRLLVCLVEQSPEAGQKARLGRRYP